MSRTICLGAVILGLALIATETSRAHDCGPTQVTLKVGEEFDWTITADVTELSTTYTPQAPQGDVGAAVMTPSTPFESVHGNFKVTALEPGTTVFSVHWFNNVGPGGSGVCPLTVTVEDEEPPAGVEGKTFIGICIEDPSSTRFVSLFQPNDPVAGRKFFMFPLPSGPGGGGAEFSACFWEVIRSGGLPLVHGLMDVCVTPSNICVSFDLRAVFLSDLSPTAPPGLMLGFVTINVFPPGAAPIVIQKTLLMVEVPASR